MGLSDALWGGSFSSNESSALMAMHSTENLLRGGNGQVCEQLEQEH